MIDKTLLIVSLALSLAEGCQEGGGSGAGNVCDIRVNVHPHYVANSDGKGRGQIEAAVKAWCDKPPTEHRLVVRLEKEASDGRTWYQVGQEKVDNTIPTSAGIVVRVATDCVDGIWRVYATAEGRGPDPVRPGADKVFKFPLPEDERMAREIRCPKIRT
jgi:hypothetical protein